MTQRLTVYLEPGTYAALLRKANYSRRSLSDLVNEAVETVLAWEGQGLIALEHHGQKKSVTFEQLMEELKAAGNT